MIGYWIHGRIVIALIAGLAASPAAAIGFYDGNKLKEWGEAYDRSLAGDKPKPTDPHDVLTFMGYVAGVNDALTGQLLCTPPGVRIHQIVVLVKKYIHAHPEMLKRPASHSVIEALSQAYPCKPKK